MRKRSSKILAASLSLLIGLNGMPFAALALENEPAEAVVSEAGQDDETPADTPEENQTSTEEEREEPEAQQAEGEAGTETDAEADADSQSETEAPGEETAGEETVEGENEGEEPPAEEATGEPEADTPEEMPQTGETTVPAPANSVMLMDANDAGTLYVVFDGDTDEDPNTYGSLAAAVAAAQDGATIVLNSDVEAHETARITNKHLTITSAEGNRYTISRDEEFDSIADNNQSHYNGAIIELNTTGEDDSDNACSVTLKNVILDDNGIHKGTYFAQTNTKSVSESNLDFVQDSMITAHGLENRAVYITLDDGAELRNFGGMSALYGTTNVHITMKAGSKVTAPDVADRAKSDPKNPPEGETGAAGAVWLQGSEFTMEADAVIEDVVGRAIYADGGSATISGTIRNITGDKEMWQGQNGTAIHLRGNAQVTMTGSAACIEEMKGNGSSTVFVEGSSFRMESGSKIQNCDSGVKGIYQFGDQKSDVFMDGEITGIHQDNAININVVSKKASAETAPHCVVGPNAEIHDNEVRNGAIYIQTFGGTLDIYGKIYNNINEGDTSAGGIYMAHNWGESTVTMYDGAEIRDNYADKYAGVIVSMGTFNMKGGVISGNIASKDYAGVYIRNGGTFIMEGGTIENNAAKGIGGGVLYRATTWGSGVVPKVELRGGAVRNNIGNAAITKEENGYQASGGEANDISFESVQNNGAETAYSNTKRYMLISDAVEIGDNSVYMQKYDITLENPARNVKFGNTTTQNIAALSDVSAKKNWNAEPLVSLWCASDQNNADLKMGVPKDTDLGLPIYVIAMPVDEEGNVLGGAEPRVYAAKVQNDMLEVSLPSDNANGYAVALVQPSEDYGTMTITVPERVNSNSKDETTNSYEISGEAAYTMSTALKGQAEVQDISEITLTVELDPSLQVDADAVTLTSDIFTATKKEYDPVSGVLTVTCSTKEDWKQAQNLTSTLKWTATLAQADFVNGKELLTTGAFNAQIAQDTKVYVPAEPGVTRLLTVIAVTPADITVYMGGKDGFDGVVNENNQIVSSNSLPMPGFTFDLPKGVTDISKVTFREVGGTKSWKAEPYDEGQGHAVYKLVAEGDQKPVRMQFTDQTSGKVVEEDKFTVGAELNRTFSMEIYKGDVKEVEAVVEGDTYGIILNTGTLTVRGTTPYVQYGDLNQPVAAGNPGVRAEQDVTFTINDSNVKANQDSIALLFDKIIEKTAGDSSRTSLLAAKADETLKEVPVPAGMVRNYEFRYLDLVDRSNGNAWVDAKGANGNPAAVTVCWPYPKGTDKNTEFTLLHYEKLHRGMSSLDADVADEIANCKVTPVTITKTDTHIEFTTTEFSPFVLVWNSTRPVPPPSTGGTTDNNKNSGSQTVSATATPATPAPTATAAPQAAAAPAVIPQTGDAMPVGLLGGAAIAAALVFVVLLVIRKRKG